MRYEQNKELDNEEFRRLTGVKRSTFERMIEIGRKIGRKKIDEKKQGVGAKASVESQSIMAMMKWKKCLKNSFNVN